MPTPTDGSRRRLLDAAEDLLSTAPDQSLSVRAVCTAAGVQLPTLYHFFESKQGLIDAVTERGYERLAEELAAIDPADPLSALHAAWRTHLRFAAEHAAIYALMYAPARPGAARHGHDLPAAAVRSLCTAAATAGLLSVSADEAEWRLSAAASGAALARIADADAAARFGDRAGEALVASLTRSPGRQRRGSPIAAHAGALRAALDGGEDASLDAPERALLDKWLAALSRTTS